MSISSVGVALTSSTKTRLFALAGSGISSPDSGNPLRGIEIENLTSGAGGVVETYIAPLDGPELTDADSWPTNGDTTRKGKAIEAGGKREVILGPAGAGRITQAWARSAGATVSYGPIA